MLPGYSLCSAGCRYRTLVPRVGEFLVSQNVRNAHIRYLLRRVRMFFSP
ncbi:unnamed protein product [Diplocarpon coronariae]